MKTKFIMLSQRLHSFFIENHPELEIDATIIASLTHWFQSPNCAYPNLTNKLKAAASEFVSSLESNDQGVKENDVPYDQPSFDFLNDFIPYPPLKKHDFTFIDLFAGIGGVRQAVQNSGGKCIFSSEWDKYAQMTYETNYGEKPFGDITKIDPAEIPDHDLLCGGFPCQPFSLAGVSKKNSMGRAHGFDDPTQGTLFFNIKEILRIKRPKAFLLENVKNLLSHDKGKTFEVVRQSLEDELGYVIDYKIVNAAKWVPQHRQRILIVGFEPDKTNVKKKSQIIIPTEPSESYIYPELNKIILKKVDDKFTLGPGTWDTLVRHKAHHAKAGNGFGYGLHLTPIKKGAITRTISARYHKDGAEILIEQKDKVRPRRLTVEEAAQLQGFNMSKFKFPVSNTQAYRQIGNSVAIPAIQATAKQIAIKLNK
ncbi:DNA (cytosine-5-)-methyltransferase [Lentisphaera profundi]|uniref:Cytosine-specific methyltransferase n=1 Tax=Lentisphaera profundi TaxID=1658616 RepID=A0ABY7VTJ2_9BACT|nr:DNA (cytosine-5-)-methyltransferase [Lentisphaera profundi]WDE97536.1 DNA (cytosine-5-)-methyltransferase [Lentisphaera profundi]